MATETIDNPATAAAEPQWFVDQFHAFESQAIRSKRDLSADWNDRWPCLEDRTSACGFDRHYVYHTAWAARMLQRIRPARHVDISSLIYFAAIASAFVPVDYYEFRPVNLQLDNLTTNVADLSCLPFADGSIESISCMHVIEHVGLGRYGDPIDSDGDLKAIAELQRVVAPGGSILFVAPIGRPRVQFNAHRVYSAAHIRGYFKTMELVEFALIPDGRHKLGLVVNPDDSFVDSQKYGCGCFWFRRAA